MSGLAQGFAELQRIGATLLGVGTDPEALDPINAVLRSVLVYAAALFLVRLGKKRFMGRGTAFDVIVGIIVGSIASRAITGNVGIVTGVAAIATLLALHWLFSALALRWDWVGRVVKGRWRVLVRDGAIDTKEMRAAHVSHADLEEDLHKAGHADVADVAEARLERDGNVSIVPRRGAPRVIEIAVADGVQRVRIELDGRG